MDIGKQKWTGLQDEIFALLCKHAGDKLTQRQIAQFLSVSPTIIATSLKLLKKHDLANIEKNRSMNLVSFNRDGHLAIGLKRVYNLRVIYLSGLVEYLEETNPGCAAILFGSFSRGEDTVKSDVDIAVVGGKGKNLNLGEYEKKLMRKIIINYYPSFKDIHTYLKSNILSGIVLSGVIEL